MSIRQRANERIMTWCSASKGIENYYLYFSVSQIYKSIVFVWEMSCAHAHLAHGKILEVTGGIVLDSDAATRPMV
jgi:hypothetical protein